MIDRILYSIILTFVGMSSVFIVLIFFFGLILLLKFIDTKIGSKKTLKAQVETVINKSESDSTTDDDELVAVITAAVHSTFGSRSKIKHIQFLDHHMQEGKWAVTGRLNIMSSHNINKRN